MFKKYLNCFQTAFIKFISYILTAASNTDAESAFGNLAPSIIPIREYTLREEVENVLEDGVQYLCPEYQGSVEGMINVNEVHSTYEDALKSAKEYTFDNPLYQGKKWFEFDANQSTISCTIEKCETYLKIEFVEHKHGILFTLSGMDNHSSHQNYDEVQDSNNGNNGW